MSQNAFVVQVLGAGDDEDEWQTVGVALTLRAARKAVVRLQNNWDSLDGNPREVRRSINWRASYHYEKVSILTE